MPSVAITWAGPSPAVTVIGVKPTGGNQWYGTTQKRRVVLHSDSPGTAQIILREAYGDGNGYTAGASLPPMIVEFV